MQHISRANLVDGLCGLGSVHKEGSVGKSIVLRQLLFDMEFQSGFACLQIDLRMRDDRSHRWALVGIIGIYLSIVFCLLSSAEYKNGVQPAV